MKRALLSRRELLGAAGSVAAGAAGFGCAMLPRGGQLPTPHRCDHRHCRYYIRAGSEGRCSLEARATGGAP